MRTLPRPQIRTAQQDPIRSASLAQRAERATDGLSGSPVAGLTCALPLRTWVCDLDGCIQFRPAVAPLASAACKPARAAHARGRSRSPASAPPTGCERACRPRPPAPSASPRALAAGATTARCGRCVCGRPSARICWVSTPPHAPPGERPGAGSGPAARPPRPASDCAAWLLTRLGDWAPQRPRLAREAPRPRGTGRPAPRFWDNTPP